MVVLGILYWCSRVSSIVSGLRFTMQQPAWVSEMAKDLPEVPFGSNIVDLPAFTGSGALDTDLYTARFRKISQLVQQVWHFWGT